ncbi:hypothetical protein F5B19DRAFT_479521 [Rostrohypoxylon terebratum]|nr:hypothetical protein F5B19DRAFT_479521 [Rostrohypoxylon terebratum]
MNPDAPRVLRDPYRVDRSSMDTSDPRSLIPCRYFARGQCLRGKSCIFMHEDYSHAKASSQTLPNIPSPAESETTTRNICGSVIQFEAGAAVAKVSLPSDFSTIRITNLPPHSQEESLRTLLGCYGLAVLSRTYSSKE